MNSSAPTAPAPVTSHRRRPVALRPRPTPPTVVQLPFAPGALPFRPNININVVVVDRQLMLLFAIAAILHGSVCTRYAPPVILDGSMGDTVALLGQDVDLTCKVDNLGRHMVAFVRSSTPPRLISFDEKIFRQKDKYELKSKMGPMNNEWVLTIKNVQEGDRGNYSCQVNADPVLTATAQLDIKVPPAVSRGTPSAVEVREGHNVTLTCKAEGNPMPTVVWRRQDKQIIRYNGATGFGASVFHGPSLHLTKVNRKHMSEYVCVASNGIPPDETWTVKLLVTFAPLIQAKSASVRVPVGGLARLVCTAESWPRPDVTWDKEGQQIFDSDNYATSQTVSGQYHSVHVLDIRRVEKHHYGSYRCTARNDNGIHFADIDLEEAEPNYLYTNAIQEGSGLVNDSDDEDSDKEEPRNEVISRDFTYARAIDTQPVRSISSSIRTRTTPRSAEELRQDERDADDAQRISLILTSIVMLLRLYIN